MIRKVSILLVLLCLFMSVCFTAYAETGECWFALSDVSVNNGRLFSTTLSIKSEEKITSFVGEISFDENKFEYRNAKTGKSDSAISVNSKEKGRITFVYLCEDGVACENETEVITFTFKAKTAGRDNLSLSVRDVIDNLGNDVPIGLYRGSSVSVTDFVSQNDDGLFVNTTTDSDNNLLPDDDTTIVKGDAPDLYLIGSAVTASVVTLVTVAYIFYKIGVRKSKVNFEETSKENKENEEKT